MKDMNFFSIYSDKNSVTYKRNRLIKIALLILILIGFIYGGLTFWLLGMEQEAQKINEYLMTDEVQQTMTEYNNAVARLNAIQDYNSQANGLIEGFGGLQNLTTEKLGIITSALPASSRMEAMDYNNGVFNFSISAPSMQIIAQTQVRLEETSLFNSVTVGNVSAADESGRYSGSLQAVMKAGEL